LNINGDLPSSEVEDSRPHGKLSCSTRKIQSLSSPDSTNSINLKNGPKLKDTLQKDQTKERSSKEPKIFNFSKELLNEYLVQPGYYSPAPLH